MDVGGAPNFEGGGSCPQTCRTAQRNVPRSLANVVTGVVRLAPSPSVGSSRRLRAHMPRSTASPASAAGRVSSRRIGARTLAATRPSLAGSRRRCGKRSASARGSGSRPRLRRAQANIFGLGKRRGVSPLRECPQCGGRSLRSRGQYSWERGSPGISFRRQCYVSGQDGAADRSETRSIGFPTNIVCGFVKIRPPSGPERPYVGANLKRPAWAPAFVPELGQPLAKLGPNSAGAQPKLS